jgi:Mrp family chromosome partitioning ATPase
VLVTSAGAADDSTTTALSLARQFSSSGHRVVIVDGNLRGSQLCSLAGATRVDYDLTDVLQENGSLDEALTRDGKSSVVVLPAKRSDYALHLIGSQAMAKVMSALRAAFDVVVINSPPMHKFYDARMLVEYADTVLVVVRLGETRRESAVEAVRALRALHAPVAGIALTSTV